MRVAPFIALLPVAANAVNLVLSNDDGWAELNIRTFYNALVSSGQSVFISAPADNESGTGSSNTPATPRTMPCEFNSCPANSPAEGYNASMPRFNYVNSYPATSMQYGIDTLAPKFFGGKPALAVAGPNVGANLGRTVLISGTVGAATYAANNKIPAIAFSGSSGDQIAWNTTPVPAYSSIYADLSSEVTNFIIKSGTPYLPSGTYLNVNYPEAGSGTSCTKASDFKFVFSRIMSASSGTPPDVQQCGSDRLPTETSVVDTKGCYASISLGNSSTKSDTSAANQKIVRDKLQSHLSCLPAS